jgi:hypothetical protein
MATVSLSDNLPIIVNWVTSLISLSDGTRRVVARVLADEITASVLIPRLANLSPRAADAWTSLFGSLTNHAHFATRFGDALLPLR